MGMITLDTSVVDWVTLTGHANQRIVDRWAEYRATNRQEPTQGERKWLQWNCSSWGYDDGEVLTGMADIRARDWMLIRASGERAHDVLMFFHDLVVDGVLKCKRIDFQMTTKQPSSWEQLRFFNRMHVDGRKPDLASSTDAKSGKQLETVAIGNRAGQTYHRIYQKITDGDEILLRYEVEFKNEKAQSAAMDLLTVTPNQQLKYQLNSRIKDGQLTAVFAQQLEGIKPHNSRPKVNTRSKRKEWLLTVVLPSFAEFVNDHQDDGEVVGSFLAVIEDFC